MLCPVVCGPSHFQKPGALDLRKQVRGKKHKFLKWVVTVGDGEEVISNSAFVSSDYLGHVYNVKIVIQMQ